MLRTNRLFPTSQKKYFRFFSFRIKAGKKSLNSRDSYKPNTLEPVFGQMFEMKVLIPQEKDLIIKVYDYDLVSNKHIPHHRPVQWGSRLGLESRLGLWYSLGFVS